MIRYPLLANEIDISNIKISDINYNNNKQFCNITYNQNEQLYIQSPIFNFIEQIKIEQNTKNNYKLLYLFLTPKDPNTYSFVDFVNKVELNTCQHLNNILSKNLNVNSLIKIHDLTSENTNRQIYMYMKITILDHTKIEYNNKLISIEDLNKLVSKVNLKLIFELNMLWISQTKIGLYLKPIRIKVIDIGIILTFKPGDQ